jgi:hypothetical protein
MPSAALVFAIDSAPSAGYGIRLRDLDLRVSPQAKGSRRRCARPHGRTSGVIVSFNLGTLLAPAYDVHPALRERARPVPSGANYSAMPRGIPRPPPRTTAKMPRASSVFPQLTAASPRDAFLHRFSARGVSMCPGTVLRVCLSRRPRISRSHPFPLAPRRRPHNDRQHCRHLLPPRWRGHPAALAGNTLARRPSHPS